MTLPLSPQVFSIVSRLIEEKVGLHYDLKESALLAEKLSVRAAELELDSLLDYYYFLRYDEAGPRELDALVELLVVNETYFYRELDQLRALVDRLLAPMLTTRARVRIWCAACSTGEEPLTLAMMLDERGLLGRTEILASDICTRSLAKAKEGTYKNRSLRALGDKERARHFVEMADGAVRVRDEILSSVHWQRINLFDVDRVQALGAFDVILCRNALIYFRDETVVRLVERFATSLSSGGLLLVGASESLLRFGTAFDCEEHGGAFFYRKSGE
jgi:chemotaxis protein methyltransferase CheR